MKRTKVSSVIIMCLVLAGCGAGNGGVSQEEYDKVVAERDELQKENESLIKISDLKAKVAEYQSKIDSEYEHAEFVLYVLGKASETDVAEYVSEMDELHSKAVDSIGAVNSLFESLSNLTDYDLTTYDATVKPVDEIYESWENFYSSILELKKYITGE